MPAVFTHDNALLLGGREDVVTTVNSIEATVNQATTFVTVGVTDHFDVSLAVPFVSNDLKVVSAATIHRIGTTNPLTHFFRQSDGEVGGSASSRPLAVRAALATSWFASKAISEERPNSSFAAGLDVRLPTGDELNLLGSGAPGLQPFGVWSGTFFQNLSPHVNVSYKWNGSSVLAGNPGRGGVSAFR